LAVLIPNRGKDRQRLSGDGIGQAEYFAGGADSFRSGQRNWLLSGWLQRFKRRTRLCLIPALCQRL